MKMMKGNWNWVQNHLTIPFILSHFDSPNDKGEDEDEHGDESDRQIPFCLGLEICSVEMWFTHISFLFKFSPVLII